MCYCHIINYAITHCHSYQRWKQIHHVMILKVPGVVEIQKLHIIALYESDLNLMLGNKWRAAMSEARRQGTLHPSQYGGCPGRDCQSVTLNEELRRDYCLLTRTSMGSMESDATMLEQELAAVSITKSMIDELFQIAVKVLEASRSRQ